MKRFNWTWAAFAVCAFASVISFFQINSWFADKNGLNGLFIVLGVLFAGAAMWFIKKV